jgi:hypothetical protein
MSKEPDPMDFIQADPEWLEEFASSVTINGAEYPLVEFNQAERHLWLKVREEESLVGLMKEFGEMRRDLEKLTGGVLVEKKEARVQKLDAEIDKFIESVPYEEWSDEHEQRLNGMIAALQRAKDELNGIQAPLEDQALISAHEMQAKMESLRERQQDIHLRFVWLLAKSRHKDTRSWDEYKAEAKGSDRQNAGILVQEGNFTWETQATPPMNRAARRASNRN